MAKSDIKANLIQIGQTPKRKVATISTRPLRLSFIINENTSISQFLKYVEYNSCIWGGVYNSLIPSDGRTLTDDWWQSLISHEPDIILACGDISPKLLHEIEEKICPFYIQKWDDEILSKQVLDLDPLGCIPMKYALLHKILQTNRPIFQTNLRIPKTVSDNPFYNYLSIHFGILPEVLQNICIQNLRGQIVEFKSNSFDDYLTCTTALNDEFTPIIMTQADLYVLVDTSKVAFFTIVLVGEPFLYDFCLYWNLRRQSFLGHREVLLVPFSVLKKRHNVESLANWCNESKRVLNYLILASATISKRQLLGCKARLLKYLDSRVNFVDIHQHNILNSRVRLYEQQNKEEVLVNGNTFRFKPQLPNFSDRMSGSVKEWCVDINFLENEKPRSGYLPPTHNKLNSLLTPDIKEIKGSHEGFTVRLANGRLSYRINRGQAYITGRLPNSNELFKSFFTSKGYKSRVTDKCKYVQGIIELLGVRWTPLSRQKL